MISMLRYDFFQGLKNARDNKFKVALKARLRNYDKLCHKLYFNMLITFRYILQMVITQLFLKLYTLSAKAKMQPDTSANCETQAWTFRHEHKVGDLRPKFKTRALRVKDECKG